MKKRFERFPFALIGPLAVNPSAMHSQTRLRQDDYIFNRLENRALPYVSGIACNLRAE
ncbi:MAG: hypothetical protein ACI845_001473 [Gammaproteobacteria bacterium]|jgi:hypothetical protein